jgi:CMP-N-acetylneuraminic acid synthetase
VVKRVAVIPARGGSKRLPRKNILPFDGKPMIAWTIEAAEGSGLFDRILVSTDDEQIAQVSREYGADVPFLRDSLADDMTPISAVTVKMIEDLSIREGASFDVVVQLMANCPLRTAADIAAAVSAFDRSSESFQISCTRYGWLNPWWAARLDEGGHPDPLFPGAISRRSQDLAPIYCPTGAIWIAYTKELLSAGTFYGPGHRFEPMPWRTAVDIDDHDDLLFASAIRNMFR